MKRKRKFKPGERECWQDLPPQLVSVVKKFVWSQVDLTWIGSMHPEDHDEIKKSARYWKKELLEELCSYVNTSDRYQELLDNMGSG